MQPNHLADFQHRQRALDPTQSFIVQAPAGSGKTELITQRFLTLLNHVQEPEEILAITFTKKSAAEMRDRIITALEDATLEKPTESPHKQTTRTLALNALKQNQIKKWNLIENPNRLRIQTIDSFNAWLARRLPTLSQFGSAPEIADDPNLLYREAIHEFLEHLEENNVWSDAIEKLLLHLDNDLNKVETLLMRMLQKRDQWLPYIAFNANDPLLRNKLEASLKNIVEDILNTLHKNFPKDSTEEFITLAKIAAQNLMYEQSKSPIIHCQNLNTLPGTRIEDKHLWLGLSELLLTQDLKWRKRLDKNIGFPSSSKETLERMKNLIEKLSNNHELHEALNELRLAPDHCYQDKQWEILASLHQTLKVVVAQLKLIFQQHGKIDYIENAHAALLALGPDEHPTDLALTLDYKIQHILVDEFQDTSNSQFHFLEKLIAGWTHDDGRTLFLVGDPMQSIYRFREAEVGLFIRSRKKGIHPIYLEPLSLTVNFRSVENIVEWVNQHFQVILPQHEDIATGAISFCSSVANKTPSPAKKNVMGENSNTTLHPFFNSPASDQAEAIIELIKSHKEKNPGETIAILVRSRTHLEYIIPTLRKNNLAYQAINIDPLGTRPVIQDLIALSKALLYPADRIAWLSILRAPWCGLTLKDLFILSQHPIHETIWQRLQDASVIHELSEDAKIRLSRITPLLQQQISERRRTPLRDWIETTWRLIGGPACIDELSDLDDANTFFKLLEKSDQGSDLICFHNLHKAIEKLYAAPADSSDQTLQIMTIHNAKGLEFDTVILPHLESKTPYDEKQLLLWMQKEDQLIIAPVHAIGDNTDSIYEYIKKQHTIKSDHECGRLLYVATTRAKKQLHLFFSLETKKNVDDFKPPANTLLEKLWPAIKNQVLKQADKESENTFSASAVSKINNIKQIKRLSTHWKNSLKKLTELPALHQKISGFSIQDNNPKYIGILIHQILENICQHGSVAWQSMNKLYIEKQLLQLGMLPKAIASSADMVQQAIRNTLNDSRGQWIIHPHPEAQTEFALTAIINQTPQQLVIDRTFIDELGTRWIIDYKSSFPDSVSINQFLSEEYKKYESQMRHYYEALRELDNRPIRLGLYFPLIPAWYEWAFS